MAAGGSGQGFVPAAGVQGAQILGPEREGMGAGPAAIPTTLCPKLPPRMQVADFLLGRLTFAEAHKFMKEQQEQLAR